MKGYLVLVGTEMLTGNTVDTNSILMAEQMNNYGIEICGKSIVGDNIEEIVDVLEFAAKKGDIVFVSGGLGPTIDDITLDAVAKYCGTKLVINNKELDKIKNKFKKAKREMPENNVKQACIPEGAKIINNKEGAAPAFRINNIVVFPGVPNELKYTFNNFIRNFAEEEKLSSETKYKDILYWGIPESKLENVIENVISKYDFQYEFLVQNYGLIFRIIYEKGRVNEVTELINELYDKSGDKIFGEDSDRLENLLADLLIKNKLDISVAESCTGGMLSEKIIGVSGASKFFVEGIVCYKNSSKVKRLGVTEKTIEEFGAVSEKTVEEMLRGLKTRAGIAISGIAGPTGGSAEKPVGTVIIGVKVDDIYRIKSYLFRGDRFLIRERASLTAINLLRKLLKEGK